MSTPNISTPVSPVIAQRQQLLVEKERLMKEEMLLDEYERTQNAYQAMADAAQVFEQKKAEYLQEEAQYETLGNSINMTTPVNASTPSNPASTTPSGYPMTNATGSPDQGIYAQTTATTTPTQTAGGPLPIEANYNPNAAAYYGAGGPGANAPLPGEGMPYYQPLPSTTAPTQSTGSPTPSGVTPSSQGVPTQANLQQTAQQAPVTPADVAALRQILQMNPQTAQQASQVSDADLTALLKSDPEIAGAVKEFQAMSAGQGVAPTGGQTKSNTPDTQPTDPAQALKLAQQNPEVMDKAKAMVDSLTPQERDAMMKQLANDPEAQAIMAQMGMTMPPSQQGRPAPAPAQKA